MTAALGNTAQGTPFATGVDAFVYPQFIGYAQRTPTTQDIYNPGTRWQDNSVNPAIIYETTGAGRWYAIAGGGETLTSLTVNGPATIVGLTNINTTGTAATDIGNATGNTHVTGQLFVSGLSTLSGGINTAPTIVAAGISPQTANNRSGQVTFSNVSIAAGATQSFVINNTTTGTLVDVSMWGATLGAALTMQSVTNVAGTSTTIAVTNGTGATTSVANITFTFICLN